MAIDKDTLLQEASCLICGGVSYADALIIALLQRIAEGSCGTCPGMLSGAGSPVGAQIPQFIGQLYQDTDTNSYWRSTGGTAADWVIISGGGSSGVDLFTYNSGTGTELSSTLLTEFTGDFWITGVTSGSALESVSFPNLGTVGGFFDLDNHPDFTTLNLDSLEETGDGTFALFLTDLGQIADITLPSLAICNGDTVIQNNPALTNLDLSALVTNTGELNGAGNAALVTLDVSSFVPTNGNTVNFANCALDEASIDLVLARCVANAAYVTGNVQLDGGTNAPPGVQGAADVLILQGRGVTVVTN